MARITTFELIDFLSSENDFSISATDKDNHTQVIITSDNCIQYIKNKYALRRYKVITGQAPATDSEAYNNFSLDFRLWITNRQKNIDLQYQALYDYPFSPIENYDRYENESSTGESETTYGKRNTLSGTDRTTYGKTDTLSGTDSIAYGKIDTLSGTDTITHSGHDVTTDEREKEIEKAGFNSPNTYTKDTKESEHSENDFVSNFTDTQQHGKTDTLSGTDRTTYGKTDTLSGTDSIAYGKTDTQSGKDSTDNVESRTLHAHGNIGVTTATSMITETLELYANSLAEMLIDNFINDYTFYS